MTRPPGKSRPLVVAATDLSPRSAHVCGRAARIARTLDADVILAHVAQNADEASAVDPDATAQSTDAAPADGGATTRAATRPGRIRRLRQTLALLPGIAPPLDRAEALAAEAEACRAKADVAIAVRLLDGEPATALADLVAETDAVLLVLGLHRERRVLDVLRLTTMERIVLGAAVPVLIAHRDPENDYRRVLALTDFSPASAAALAMAGRLAPAARFHAIHALQLPLGARFSADDPATDAAITRAEMLRTAFLAMPDLPGLHETPEIVPGGVHEVLAFRQQELDADLVCVGTHSGRDPGQLGNYARDLMRAPPTDLLVAKPGPTPLPD